MSFTISLRTVLATCSILSLAPQVLAHMEMSWPYPLHSKYDPSNSYTVIDYSMTAPLSADGSNFPCKGYQNDRPVVTKATYEAGHTYNMTLAGSATHGGGSCQLSLSYDNGATFRVIKSMIGGCPLVSTYDFTIPSYVPDGNALFAWSWQNLHGNREFYMNCAEVDIVGSTSSKRDDTSFEDLPFIYKANIPDVNSCVTIESVTPVYPEPGPDVIYGTGATSSSAATSDSGECDAATPFGAAYKYLGDTVNPTTEVLSSGAASTRSVASSSSSKSASTTASTTLITSSKSATSSSSSKSIASSSSSRSAASSTSSFAVTTTQRPVASKPYVSPSTSATSLMTLSSETCPPDVTITVYADATATSTVTAKSPSLTGSTVSTVIGFSTGSSSTVVVVSAATSTAKGASSSKAASGTSSAAGAEVTEGYATGDLATYLPCVPATFICTSNTTWVTCDQTMYSDGSTAWVYEESRAVGSGMACVPNLSPYSSSTSQYAQQADAPSGYYRDDRIAAAQTYGSCTVDGSIECTSNGSQFLICDHGGWVMMGAVAAGTTCTNGAIVASS